MERSLANLNERITAVELDGDRAGRTQSPRMATVRPGARESGGGSAFKGSCRPEAPRRRTVGTNANAGGSGLSGKSHGETGAPTRQDRRAHVWE